MFCSFVLHAVLCVQISDLLAELADERSTGESASQLLETETSERLRLEKEMKDLQVHTNRHFFRNSHCERKKQIILICVQTFAFQAKFDSMKKKLESQELELIEVRLMKTSDLNGQMDDDDDDAG